jgi:hypothetical protein
LRCGEDPSHSQTAVEDPHRFRIDNLNNKLAQNEFDS